MSCRLFRPRPLARPWLLGRTITLVLLGWHPKCGHADATRISHHYRPPPTTGNNAARLASALGTLPLSVAELQRRWHLVQYLRGGNSSNNNNGSSSSSYTPPNTSHLQQHMAEEDAMIDDLAAGVSRMRDQTQVVHDEAPLHVNMLGDMEVNLGAAQSGVDVETKRAAKLTEDKSVWRLQLIIAGEAVLCLLLLLMGLS